MRCHLSHTSPNFVKPFITFVIRNPKASPFTGFLTDIYNFGEFESLTYLAGKGRGS